MNTEKGRAFQQKAAEVLSQHFGVEFQKEYSFPIGHPPKEHKFDLVSLDRKYVGESKNYSWTETGNVPSAKMGFVNEAVFYLQHVPPTVHRFVVMRRDTHPKRGESLAEYYYRANRHLLNGVFVVEIDLKTEAVREFGR
jgi:hypothetical protein